MSDAATPQVSRGLLIVLGVVVGLAVLAGLYMFVVQPLLEDPVADPEIPAGPEAADPEGEVGPDDEADEAAPPISETFEVFAARDPFQQLVTRPREVTDGDGADPAQPGTGPTDPSAPTAPTDPTAPTTPTDPSAPQPPAPGPGQPTPREPPATRVGATQVRLVDVVVGEDGVERVQVTVNGTGYDVGAGDTFADTFRVLDITGQCATFLFGDSRFTLCRGEEIRK